MSRLLIASNRLPVTVRAEGEEVRVERSMGGLATGMSGPHERSGGLWVGWPGTPGPLSPTAEAAVARRLEELKCVPVTLDADEVARFYEGYANGVLWPLLHSFAGQLPLEVKDFDAYERVNRKFAEALAAQWRPGDRVWIHDYQLMRLPRLLRDRVPGARIGFFLHVPFPSSELFRILPHRELVLEGVLGADLVGFHTASYLRHFSSSVLRILGAPNEIDRIRWRGREVGLGVFPMGIDAGSYASASDDPAVVRQAAELREGGVRLLVGIDRLDYTKGIPRRLLAYERLLDGHPELREKVKLIQVAVPSRTDVERYQEFREQMDGLVGRIHGAFATAHWSPVHYLFRGLSQAEVVGLYRAADVLLVTPIRDGMNLVAKEFVASRTDEDGVLVLSEFAGAAAELAEAVHVNPYDVEGTAQAYLRALSMPLEERRSRMRALRARVAGYDVHRWARSFLERLEEGAEPRAVEAAASPPRAVRAAQARVAAAPHLVLLLDYDGTLVPFASRPEQAAPDPELRELLGALAARPGTAVHVVSGRRRETLEEWLDGLPVGLHAEHGLWSRPPGGRQWVAAPLPDTGWRGPVRDILDDFAARTPGALVEEKTVGLAWHYRMADPDFGAVQARDLMMHLSLVLSNAPVEILPGHYVVEVRPQGVHKGLAVAPATQGAPPDALVVALGDDRTDEDLFSALPPGSLAIHVGPSESRAALRLADVPAARAFLRELSGSRVTPR